MGALFYLVLLVALLAYWDLKIKILLVFHAPSGYRYLNRRVSEMAAQLFRNACLYGGLKVDISSAIPDRLPDRFMVISNHQSLADIPFLMIVFRAHQLRFIAKKSLGRWFPAVSAVLRYQHHALIRREGRFAETYRELRRVARAATHGIVPVVFPEGTRSKTGSVNKFFDGAVRTILQANPMPVVVVAVDGGYRFSRLRQVIRYMRGATYRGRLLATLPEPRNKAELLAVVESSRTMILDEISKWREQSGADDAYGASEQ